MTCTGIGKTKLFMKTGNINDSCYSQKIVCNLSSFIIWNIDCDIVYKIAKLLVIFYFCFHYLYSNSPFLPFGEFTVLSWQINCAVHYLIPYFLIIVAIRFISWLFHSMQPLHMYHAKSCLTQHFLSTCNWTLSIFHVGCLEHASFINLSWHRMC